ncbi:MAG TPA: hypothetical protein VHI78_01270 [Bacteroidales bacterium]|jgi:hypothetical protein|nr:hypothetical protein [Bacteroidales bacterium]
MKDSFEKFINENREKFDNLEPDKSVWKRLQKELPERPGFNWKVFMRRAAIVTVIFAASYFANEMIHRFNNRSSSTADKTEIPGLSEAEAYYTSLVNQKLDELKPVIENCPSIQEELDYDMSELDSVYVDLKKDLKDNMANQEVIEAIIENYRLKISILEDILSELSPLDEECIPNTGKYAL